jgi:hypothetical protein
LFFVNFHTSIFLKIFENLIVGVQKGRIMVSYICCIEERIVKMPQSNVVFAETAPLADQIASSSYLFTSPKRRAYILWVFFIEKKRTFTIAII